MQKKILFVPSFAAASFFPGLPASSRLTQAGAGSSAGQQAGQVLGSWWESCTGPQQGESGQLASLGSPKEFVSSGREGCLNGKLK